MTRISGSRILRETALLAVLLLAGAAAPTAAATIEGEAGFSPGDVRWGRLSDYDTIEIPGFMPGGAVGHPELPEKSLYYLLPAGYRVAELRVTHLERLERETPRRLLPSRGPRWREEGLVEAGEVYRSNDEYPGKVVELVGVGKWRGDYVAQVVYRPVGYRPAGESIILYPRVEFSLVLAPGEEEEPALAPLRSSREISREAHRLLASHVENLPLLEDGEPPERGVATYTPFRPTVYPSLDGSLVEYLIITTDNLAGYFQSLADWKTQCGIPAVVRTTSWIEENYPGGADLGEKIRLFIRDAYQNWGTYWVLLGGDSDVIPVRYAHIDYYFEPQGEDIPTDLYFAGLDGGWDGDGDGRFGEGYNSATMSPGDSVDFYPEVMVGRAPVNTITETETFVGKSRDYRRNPIPGNQKTVYLVGEVLFPFGWEPPAPVWLNGCDIVYDAMGHVPSDWDTVILCEFPHGNMNFDSVYDSLDQGFGLVTLVTHGDAFKLSTSDGNYIRMDDIQTLGNDDQFSVYYYSNCNTSQFDSECLNEAALFNRWGGGVAAIAPTRLEFPHVSRYYLTEFYRLFFTSNLYTLGELSEIHRVFGIGSTTVEGAYRWAHLTQVLLGDPQLVVWKEIPDSVTLAHADTMSLGDTTYTVTVNDASGGGPVEGARVVLWSNVTDDYARGCTDAAGQVVFDFRPSRTGAVVLTAVHPDFMTKVDYITVGGGAGFVHLEGTVIDDDDVGLSSGNGDGLFDAGERVELGVTLANGGDATTTGVNASLGLATGASLILDVWQDGSRQEDRVFVGLEEANPESLPVTVGLGDPSLSPWGRPSYTAAAPEDSGAYFWQDVSGWHLRFASGSEAQVFSGSLSTDGELFTAVPWGLELDDTLNVTSALLGFNLTVDGSDLEDGIDFVLADSSNLTVLSGAAAYGDLAPGDTATRFFLLESASDAPDRHQGRLELAVTGTNLATTFNWLDGLRLEVGAPVLTEEFHAVDDSTDGGNGNGQIEVGETVLLTPHVCNRGHGAAPGLQGILRPVVGVTVTDSTDSFGDIPAGELVTGAGGFRLTCNSPAMLVELELRDSYGRAWTEELELDVPMAPSYIYATGMVPGVETAVDLVWSVAPEADLLGYNVYRSPVSGSGYDLLSDGIVWQSAYYQDLAVSSESTYYYRVAVVDSAGNQSRFSPEAEVTVRPPYQGIWPRTTEGTIWASPLLVDLGEDTGGDVEVVVGGEDRYLYCWRQYGSNMPGWPKRLGGEIWSSAAAGNLDGDDALEIVVGCNNYRVYAFNHDGSGLTSGDGVFAVTGSQVRSTPALADLDSDLDLEVVVGSYDGKVYAWHHDGTAYAGTTAVFAHPGEAVAASPTICDLDSDGDLEILIPTLGGKIFAYHHDGSTYGGPTGVFCNTGSEMWASAAVGDLNGDGVMEVVGACWDGKVYRWYRNGTVATGWPKTTGGAVWSSPALGDLDGNGSLEIVVGSSDWMVYAFDFLGNNLPGWPVTTEDSVWSSPILADISGDGSPDVIVTSMDSRIHAWEADGSRVPGWPLVFPERCFGSAPAAGDLDGDGDVEVLAGSYDGRVYCWDVGHAWDPSPAASPWPLFCHDALRTGWYDRDQLYVSVDPAIEGPIPTTYGLSQNFPNPFNPRTVIRYQLAEEGPISLLVYDVTGRRVRELISGTERAGYYEVLWDGTDDGGHSVATGVYFYRLEAGGRVLVHKMILLK